MTTTTESRPRFMAAQDSAAAAAMERRIKELEVALARGEKEAQVSGAELFDPEIFQPTHLALPENFGPDAWFRLWYVIQNLEGSLPWWVGDMLNEGERRHGDLIFQALGDRFEYSTMMEHRRVCDRLPKSIRRADVAWTHHKYVADVTDANNKPDRARQKAILKHVADNVDNGWTTEQTRFMCQEAKAEIRGTEPPEIVSDSSGMEEPPPAPSGTSSWTITTSAKAHKRAVEEIMQRHEAEIRAELEEASIRADVGLRRNNI